MTAILISRKVVASLVLVAASGAAIGFGITQLRREPPAETRAAAAALAVASPAAGDREQGSAPLATVQAEANGMAAAPDVSLRSPDPDASVPVFDVARIERTGEAVIAGRAAPGAIVELLRNGEPHDRALADQSGQFVMIPSRLPPGDYELTLRSRQPDGKQATSKQSVAVALNEVESVSSAPRSRAELPFNDPKTVVATGSVLDQAVGSQAHAAIAAPPSDKDSPSTGVGPKIATTVVSRGDSLWRISRVTYGVGTRYAVVYKANRDQIRNPNRIYPGQIFFLPMKAR